MAAPQEIRLLVEQHSAARALAAAEEQAVRVPGARAARNAPHWAWRASRALCRSLAPLLRRCRAPARATHPHSAASGVAIAPVAFGRAHCASVPLVWAPFRGTVSYGLGLSPAFVCAQALAPAAFPAETVLAGAMGRLGLEALPATSAGGGYGGPASPLRRAPGAPAVKGPSGPRRAGEGVEEEEQAVVAVEKLANGGLQAR